MNISLPLVTDKPPVSSHTLLIVGDVSDKPVGKDDKSYSRDQGREINVLLPGGNLNCLKLSITSNYHPLGSPVICTDIYSQRYFVP